MRRLDALRADRLRRWTAVGVGAAVGLALAWVHWLGLVVGGALVALPTANPKRGALAGLGFGALVLVAFAGVLALRGALVPALGMGRITALTVAIPLVAGLLGGLTRALV